jgi:hypothetical protein
MKTFETMLMVQACLLAACAAMAGVASYPLDLTTGSAWRTGANPSIEADRQYGSDGYVLFGINLPDGSYTGSGYDISADNANNQHNLPANIGAVVVPEGVSYSMWSGNGNFGQMEDPANGNAFTATPALLRSTRPGDPCDLILQRATSDAFRLTLIIGISSDGGYPNNAVTVTVNAGAAGSAAGNTSASPNGGQAGTPGMMYLTFDVDSGADDILVSLVGSGADLAGLVFDPPTVTAPGIAQQPAGGTYLVGIPFQLTVAAFGSEPRFYQWYKGASPLPDETNSALSFASLALKDQGSYEVVVTNMAGSVTSSPVVLEVAAALPAKAANYENAVQSELSIFAYYPFNTLTADDLTTVHNGTLAGGAGFAPGLGGGADKALLLNASGHVNLGASEDFDFTDTTGSVEAWIRADWNPAAPPAYNPTIFASRGGGPTRWSIHMAQSTTQLAFWNGAAVAWVSIPKAGTNWHHFVSVFDNGNWTVFWDGESVGTFPLALGGATAQPTQIGSAAESFTQEGWIGAIDEVAFYSDALTAEAASAHYIAYIAGDPPTIVAQAQGGLFLAGIPVTLAVTASGPPPLAYKWYKDSSLIPGADTSQLSFASLANSNAGTYLVVVSNPGGSVTSSPVVVQIAAALPPKVVNYEDALQSELSIFAFYPFDNLTADDLTTAHNGTLFGKAIFGTGIGGGADKTLLLNGGGHVSLGTSEDFEFPDTTGSVEAWLRADWASSPGYNPCVFANRGGTPTHWSIHMAADKSQMAFWNGAQVAWIPLPANAGTTWHHFVSVFDNGTWLVYWDGQLVNSAAIGLGASTGLPTQIASSSESSTAEGWIGAIDEVAFYSDALSPEAVRAHFDAFHAGEPPVIVGQPQGGKFLAGADVTLAVNATGPQLSYQWYRNGEPVPDATGAILTFANATPENSGTYRVTVGNLTATLTSSNAVIVVVVPDLAAYRASVLAQSSLISYYPFDDGTANDVVSVNHGTLVGAAAFEPGLAGDPNQALALTGGHVTLGQVDALDFASKAGTVELLLRADWTGSPGYNPTIFADRELGPVNYSIHMMVAKDQIAFWNGSAVSLINIPSAGLAWHHLAVVFDAGTWSLYWDGRPLGTQSLAMGTHPEAPTDLGSASSGGTEQWPGALDEVGFFSTALSAETIQEHYGALVKAAPSLHYQKTGNQLSFSWTATGFKLQANSDLANPAGWQDVAGGDTSPASVTIGATGKLFFRLMSK